MEGLPYESNCTLDLPGWREFPVSKIKVNEVPQSDWTMRNGDALDIGYHSLSYGPARVRTQKGTRGDRSPEKNSLPDPADQGEMQLKVDFFRKLGYSSEEIHGVLQSLGVDADTNTVLGELVKHGANPEKEALPEDTSESLLVPRGGLTTRAAPSITPTDENDGSNLRPIVIDGSNVAMSHGNKEVFSCRGILLAINCFLERGHTDITVFVPSWRKEQHRPEVPITDQHILIELEKKKILVFTPSRRVGGKRLVCYDDRFIVKLACACDGVIVSNDTYRDLQSERLEWKKFIEERLLMYSFANDIFMLPDDPLGRHGPSLENFLRKKASLPENKKIQCPYGKKCTYGMKCKFYHPERINQPQRSVADELRANARLSPTKGTITLQMEDKKTRKLSLAEIPSVDSDNSSMQKLPVERTNSLQKGKAMDNRMALNAHYNSNNGASEWYSSSSTHMDSLPFISQDCLDSGLGSLDNQLAEMWPGRMNSSCNPSHHDQMGPGSFCSCSHQRHFCQHSNSLEKDARQHYNSQKPVSQGHSAPPFFPYNQDVHSHSRSCQSTPHNPTMYRRESANTASTGNHSLPDDYNPASTHSPKYWSEPYQIPHPSRSQNSYPVYRPMAPSCTDFHQWPTPDQYTAERLSVRTKLCMIFQPQLVDAVMNMFPQLLDPQRLAAEIFSYKSQNRM
ncbi:hypothetical protein FKM82_013736 [Ascaphus truei]